MSGWNAYVDTQLVATGAICQAGIFGKADIQCYANAGDFQVYLPDSQEQQTEAIVCSSLCCACETEGMEVRRDFVHENL